MLRKFVLSSDEAGVEHDRPPLGSDNNPYPTLRDLDDTPDTPSDDPHCDPNTLCDPAATPVPPRPSLCFDRASIAPSRGGPRTATIAARARLPQQSVSSPPTAYEGYAGGEEGGRRRSAVTDRCERRASP